MSLLQLFVAVLIASLVGFGGLSSLPVMRNQLLGAGLPADAIILQSLAVGNISPGPNGLYLVAIGYFVGGWGGTLVAAAALAMPPLLVLPLEHARTRLLHMRRFRAAMNSLGLSVVALLAISSATLVAQAASNSVGAVMVGIGAVVLLRGLPSIYGIAAAVAIGLLLMM